MRTKEKRLKLAIKKFQKREASVLKSSNLAGIPLTSFLESLHRKRINFHYGKKEFKEDVGDLL